MKRFPAVCVMAVVVSVVGFGCAAFGQVGATPVQQSENADGMKPPKKGRSEKTVLAYPLAVCPLSGKAVTTGADAVVETYEGREIRFCCELCPATFERDVAKSLAAVDALIVKDQLPLYPITTSIVTGKPLPEKSVDWVFENRLIRLGAEAEKKAFGKDPAKFVAALDKAVSEKQGKDYPLVKCPVSDEALDSMGGPKDIVVAGRLVQVCCKSCVKTVLKEPMKFVAMVDAARKEAGEKAKGLEEKK